MPHVEVYRAKIDPANVERLLEIRPRALEEVMSRFPELLRADLIRLDEETWLDVLTWSAVVSPARLVAANPSMPAAGEMHGLIAEVVSMERGEQAHTTTSAVAV